MTVPAMKPKPDMAELARLMETFNNAFETLKVSHDSLEQRASAMERELDQKRRMALLGEVSAAMAHEIRNPLGGIQIYAEMLRRDLAADAEKVEILDKIIGCVRDLNRFVEDILTYAGNVHPRAEPAAVEPVLDRAIALSGAAVDRRFDAAVRARVDSGLIERVFLNLIRNAAEAGGPVTVRLEAAGAGCRVAVSDRGPGIPPEVREKLFTPFFTTKAKGTGLGLALARKIVLAHGGTLEARANDDGPGATFEVRLPG